jgi:hypothetical protein
MGTINNLSSTYLQSVLASTPQATALATGSSPSGSSLLDSGQLSPFAQLIGTLQQLEQSNPTEYQQVTGQIATNLQSAAQTAQTDGNTALANQLNQLAADFSNASTSGQPLNLQDSAQAGGHHHHHHHGSANGTQDESLNPLSIIENTLSSAGITVPQ